MSEHHRIPDEYRSFDDWTMDAIEDGAPLVFGEVFLDLLPEGRVSALSLAYVLLESPEAGGWEGLRAAAVANLWADPPKAAAVMNVANSAMGWPALSYETSSRGDPHEPTWQAVATLTRRDIPPLKTIGWGGKINLAKQRACVAMLAALADVAPPVAMVVDTHQARPVKAVHAEPVPCTDGSKHPVAAVYEHAAQAHVKHPSFVHSRVERDGVESFVVTVRCRERAASGSGRTKKDARRAACEAWLAGVGTIEAAGTVIAQGVEA